MKSKLLKLDDRDLRTATMIGMAAFFSALFGTPLGAAVFSLEVISVGLIYHAAFIPCFIASLTAYGVDFQQMEPAGAGYILERMRLLDCKIAMPTEKNADGEELQRVHYTATLAITPLNGSWEETRYYRVKSNRYEGFYFEAEGTEEEIYQDLSEQKSAYMNWFNDDICSITFRTYDMELDDVIKRLNDPNNF